LKEIQTHAQLELIPGLMVLLERGRVAIQIGMLGALPLDLGSVNAPPPLEHRQSGVGWSETVWWFLQFLSF